eukprot:scaffold87629_cov90-Phaeocystis_antarctica.AAC.1
MRLPTGSRHSQRVAATLLSYRRLRYAGSTATTSATLRVSVTRTARARYSVTRYSEPGERTKDSSSGTSMDSFQDIIM